MSEELANKHGLKIGQKILYPHQLGSNYGDPICMNIETLKDVVVNYKNEVVVYIEGTEGYINLDDIYTRESINYIFDFHEDKTKVKEE